MSTKKNKPAKTVQIKQSGKVKVTFEGMAILELCQFLYNGVAHYEHELSKLDSKAITSWNYHNHAALTLLFTLYNKHFPERRVADEIVLELSKTEAILLWGIYQELNYSPYLLMNIFLNIHQKLS